LQAHLVASHRVLEAEGCRMQEQARRLDDHPGIVAYIDRLTDERMAKLGQVNADLMRLAGLEADLAQGRAPERLHRAHVGDGRLTDADIRISGGATQPVAAIRHQATLDASIEDRAMCDAQIGPLDVVLAK